MIIYYSVDVTSDFFFFKQKTAYEMRISDWSSDVCSSDLKGRFLRGSRPPSRHRDGPRLRRAHRRSRTGQRPLGRLPDGRGRGCTEPGITGPCARPCNAFADNSGPNRTRRASLVEVLQDLTLLAGGRGTWPVARERFEEALLALIKRLADDPAKNGLRIALAELLDPAISGLGGLALLVGTVQQLAGKPVRALRSKTLGSQSMTDRKSTRLN